jgi:hypothetical protein
MSDATAVKAYSEKSKSSPYAWLVYLPQGDDLTQMGKQIPRQWASDTLAALALAFVMGLAGLSFRRRLALAAAAVMFAWLNTADSVLELVPLSARFHLGLAGRATGRLAARRCGHGVVDRSARAQAGILIRPCWHIAVYLVPSAFIAAGRAGQR